MPSGPFECGFRTSGVVSAPLGDLPALHKDPAPGRDVPPAATKYADDQAIVAVAATLQAVRASGLPPAAFADWGVVAAPRWLGRYDTEQGLARFERRGASGVPARCVPYMSLHATAGAVSLALGCHGPNVGAGGGPGAAADGLLAGLTVCADRACPGVWVVLTEWDPEPAAADDPAGVCHGVALGLTAGRGVRLERGGGVAPSVVDLGRFLDDDFAATWACALAGGWRLALTKDALARRVAA